MTNKRSRKRAIFISLLSTLLCFSMFVGTTFAWFTDSVSSANNIIVAGKLDVEMYYQVEGQQDWSNVTANTNVFKADALWEPGYTEVVKLKVVNAGDLALKYQLGVSVASETTSTNVYGEELKLSRYVMYGIVDGDQDYDRDSAIAAVASTALALENAYNSGTIVLLPNEESIVTMVVYIPKTVGNEANAMKNAPAPTINLGLDLFATQMANEEDAFGPEYDEGAPILTKPVVLPATPADLTLTGSPENAVSVALPASVIEALPAEVTEIGLAISAPVVDATAKTITFDSIEVVDQDGNIVDLADLALTENITVTLPAQTTFAAGETVAIYHDGAIVATAVVDANGKISYDVAHLCEVSVGAIEEPTVNANGEIEIANASQLYSFANSVNAGTSYKGKTVVLTDNIDLNNTPWTPIGNFTYDITTNGDGYVYGKYFEGTFDGQGYTISNLYVDAYETSGIGLFGYAKNATFKNLTINNVELEALSHAAAIVARAQGNTTVTNCHVTGNIDINAYWAYIGGIVGKAYSLTISDCTVMPAGTGVLNSENRNAVGSILAWVEQTSTITNCKAQNMNLTGWANIGGITGFINAKSTIDGCSATNMTITKTRVDGHPSVGYIAGGWNGKNITIKNNTATNITFNGTCVNVSSADLLYGSEFYGALDISGFILENNTATEITNNLFYADKAISDAASLKEAFANGGKYVLKADLVVSEKMTVASGKEVILNLGGNTLSGAFDNNGGSALIENCGSLTIMNGKVVSLAAYPDVDWGEEGFPTYATNTISNRGNLVIEDGAVIENETNQGGASYAVDNYAGATLTVNGGKITAKDVAIRMFSNSATAEDKVVINAGTITGKRAIWIQLPSSNSSVAPLTTVIINGGEFNSTSETTIYSYSYGNSFANTTITINGGVFSNNVAFGGGYKGDQETVTVTGGTFNGYLGRYLANDGWVDIVKP